MELLVRVRETRNDARNECSAALERGEPWHVCLHEWELSVLEYCEGLDPEPVAMQACLDRDELTLMRHPEYLAITPVYVDAQAIYGPSGSIVAYDTDWASNGNLAAYCDDLCGPQDLDSEAWLTCSQSCWRGNHVSRTTAAAPAGLLGLHEAIDLCAFYCGDDAVDEPGQCFATCLAKGPTAQDQCELTGICVPGTVDQWTPAPLITPVDENGISPADAWDHACAAQDFERADDFHRCLKQNPHRAAEPVATVIWEEVPF